MFSGVRTYLAVIFQAVKTDLIENAFRPVHNLRVAFGAEREGSIDEKLQRARDQISLRAADRERSL